jgi:phosphohistidine phosphatase SixA
MKNHFAFFLLVLTMNLFAQAEKPTRIYVVRHAEKITSDPKENDPSLTEKGYKRAVALAKKLKHKPLHTIYSTNYRRNKSTVLPTAEILRKEINLYDPKNLQTTAATILKENKGKYALVVGHSNTVLETIEALGGKRPLKSISDQDYDYLFLVTISANGKTKVKVMHYGEPNSQKEGEEMMH